MSSKHFLDNPNHAVIASLRSLTLTNPSLLFDEANKIVYRHPSSIRSPGDKIALVCGGGSGHEPFVAGYVGQGFLTACVSGSIFASPTSEQIQACIARRLPRESKGILVLLMNYTGDVLNFGRGVEKARATGKNIEMVVVGDDVGVGREKGGKVGRRGIAGTVLVVKICGALADMGASLEETAKVGRLAAENVASVAVSLSRVHVPGRPHEDATEEAERLPYGTVELGMGIHNEAGCEKLKTDLPNTVKKMLAQLLDQDDNDRGFVKFENTDKIVMLINNLGGLSNLELGAITTEVWTQLGNGYGIKPVRIISGTLNGSLNGLGFGVTLMRMADTGVECATSMLELIDYPTEVIGWPAPIKAETWERNFELIQEKETSEDEETQPGNIKVDPVYFKKVLNSGLERLIAAEPDVTKFDTIVGDGDCGISLKRGAESVLNALGGKVKLGNDLLVNFSMVVRAVEKSMDGTSGALYTIFLHSLARNLRIQDAPAGTEISSKIWAEALKLSLQSLMQYTPAQPGDRTLIDALSPFVATLGKTGDTKEAAAAAQKGSESTRGMKASLGRTVYVGGEGWQGVPDPGAHGLSEFLAGIADAL